ncbi:extracellular solute-binding protein [Maritimibacter fusiformis]|uniref:Extracellular solute-binding protein n=2 Tax=Maritimibacter fusiformis TaxID=2603819 RepID=A0A5D0RSC1_9RHOB|nr:extracellular solute-binding protein [Maritimibacter fusiformis]
MAQADCGIEKGSVRVLSNDFEALRVVGGAVKECASGTVSVELDQTTEHKAIQVPALTTNPAAYTVAVVATNSIVPLLGEDLIRPLDEYVEKWGQDLLPQQLIKVNGKVMAIAFLANGQHLYYRDDILSENGIEPPQTFDEILAASRKLRDAGVMDAPFGTEYLPGWGLAAEFINAYLGTGADFFEPGSAKLAISGEAGVETLERMKAFTEYMRHDYSTDDSSTLIPLWKEGELAMMFAWGSRARELMDPESNPTADVTRVAAMPAAVEGGVPAAALWWDGFSIARNVSDEDAEASFRAMVHGIRPEMAKEHRDVAVWLVKGYEPTKTAEGVAANIAAGARPYPMLPYMGFLHSALGENLGDYMQGLESAEQALADVEAAYSAAARESGYLK